MRRSLAALLLLVGCGLTACGGNSDTDDAEPSKTDSRSVGADAAEQIYLGFMKDEGFVPRFGTDEEALSLARDVCSRYDDGENFVDIVKTLTDTGFTGYEAGQINGAATAAFCPEHATR